MNPFKKLAGQTAIYGLPTIVGRLLNYLLVPLYTRAFLPAEYGVVTEMYAYVAFLFVILTYGMETAFFRFATRDGRPETVFGTAFSSLAITSVLFTAAGMFFSPGLSVWMGYENHPEYIRWFVLILATDALSTLPYANLRLKNRPFRFAFVKITNIVTNIGFNLFFIVLCPYILKHTPNSSLAQLIQTIYNPEIGVGYIFIANLIASVLTFLMLLPEMLKQRLQLDARLLKQMLAYAWPLLIFGLAGIVNETFDRIILKYLLPDKTDAMAQLGIYGACYKVSIIMTLFIQTYRYAAEPFFFDQASQTNAKETYARLMHFFIIICLFIFLSVMLYLDVVLLFVGEAFREGAGVVPILLMANLFLGVFYNLSIWFKLTDNTRKGAVISVIGALVTLALNFALIPLMGYMGAAWATFACYAAMMVISWLWGQKYYPVQYDLKGAGLYLLITVSIYGLSVIISPEGNAMKYIFNTSMLLLFALYVGFNERKQLLMLIGKG